MIVAAFTNRIKSHYMSSSCSHLVRSRVQTPNTQHLVKLRYVTFKMTATLDCKHSRPRSNRLVVAERTMSVGKTEESSDSEVTLERRTTVLRM